MQINLYKKILFFSIFSTSKHGKYLCNIYLKYPKIKKNLSTSIVCFFLPFLVQNKNIPTSSSQN